MFLLFIALHLHLSLLILIITMSFLEIESIVSFKMHKMNITEDLKAKFYGYYSFVYVQFVVC